MLGKYAGRDGEASFDQDPRFSEFTLPMPVQVKEAVRAQGGRKHHGER